MEFSVDFSRSNETTYYLTKKSHKDSAVSFDPSDARVFLALMASNARIGKEKIKR